MDQNFPPPVPPTPPSFSNTPVPSNTSTSSVVALILGILSITCCGFFSGIPAIFIGRSELKAIEEGRIHPSNSTVAKLGLILGIIGTGLFCLAFLFYFGLLALGLSLGKLAPGSGF